MAFAAIKKIPEKKWGKDISALAPDDGHSYSILCLFSVLNNSNGHHSSCLDAYNHKNAESDRLLHLSFR